MMHDAVINLLQSYGYPLLFMLVALESLGVPLPGETALVSAAAFAATGHLSICAVVITAASAAIAGDNGGYWIGRKGGIALLHRYGRARHTDQSKLANAHDIFERHGAKIILLGRFIALLRTWAAVLAGIGRMRYKVFMFYNALGAVLWATLFGTLGYMFGQNLPRLEHYVGQASLALVLLIALVVAILLAWLWFRRNETGIALRILHSEERLRYLRFIQWMRNRHPRIWGFVIARFLPDEYLGLHLTIGLAFSAAALWLFAAVTEDVVHHDPLTQFDVTLLEWLHRHNTAIGTKIFQAISFLGSPAFMAALGLGVALVLARSRRWVSLAIWAAALGGAGLLDQLLKVTIRRPRPVYASAFFTSQSFSFPSGHAMASLVAYGMVAYLLARFWAAHRSTRIMLFLSAFALALAIGISRLYLGVHYFSDVIGGYAAGSVWLATCVTGLELRTRKIENIDSQRG
jgi:membrane protein DedA with SNARE-associated domain/membrane-associated phospholipid phosphatase